MKPIHKIIVVGLVLFCTELFGQQDTYHTLYRYNMNLVNPAYTGIGEGKELTINVRDQWANIEGAPQTQGMFLSTPMRNSLGIGVSITNDQTFIERQTSLAVDFSYKVQLDRFKFLYFGIKPRFNSYNVNTAGLMTYGISSDPSLTNLDNSFKLNFGAGVLLKNDRYFISLSLPRILQYDRLQNNNGTASLNRERLHVYLAGGHNFPLSETIVYKPSVMYRYTPAAPNSLDFTHLLSFSEQVEVGAAYRLKESFSGIFVLKAIIWMDLGYAYEVPVQGAINGIDHGTHEIMLKLKF